VVDLTRPTAVIAGPLMGARLVRHKIELAGDSPVDLQLAVNNRTGTWLHPATFCMFTR